jgi:hypothetical protein
MRDESGAASNLQAAERRCRLLCEAWVAMLQGGELKPAASFDRENVE